MNIFGSRFSLSTGRSLLAGLAATFALACSPSINPALKSSIDNQLGQVQANGQVWPVDSPPAGFSAGQWLQYKVLDDKEQPSIMTYKLLETDGFRHVVETVTESYFARHVTYMELQYSPESPLQSLEILRVVTADDSEPNPREANSFELSMMRSMYAPIVEQLFIRITPGPSSSVTVSPGVFEGATEQTVQMAFGPISYTANSYHHPAIPIHGMVKSVRTDGTPGSTELIAFGLSGAESEIQ